MMTGTNAAGEEAQGRPSIRGCTRESFLLIVCLFAAAPMGASAQPLPLVAEELAAALGFGASEVARMWRGEIVSQTLDGTTEKELAVAVMMRLHDDHRDFFERARSGLFFEVDRTVLDAGEIPENEPEVDAFAALSLDPSELQRLARARPGPEFNLTEAESLRLRSAAKGGDAEVLDAYRRILTHRLREYRQKGIDGISSYARGSRPEARPSEDLRSAVASLAGLSGRCPSFYGSFSSFPARSDPAVSHRFFWAVQRVQDRPTVVLSHWVLQLHPDFAILGQRQFYVGQGYDALQTLVGAFAVGQGDSLVFYLNRTSTEQVSGFGSSIAHRLGGKVMLDEVESLFRALRASSDRSLEAGESPPRRDAP